MRLEVSADREFDEAIRNTCENENIQCTDYFLQKIHQINDLMKIRSGIMIIGQPFGGKTTACRMFARALDKMAHQNGCEQFNGKVQLAGKFKYFFTI